MYHNNSILIPESSAYNQIMYFGPLCYLQIQTELDLSTPHLRRAKFFFHMKTMANMTQKRQHVWNVRADVPYMLRFLTHFCNGFYS